MIKETELNLDGVIYALTWAETKKTEELLFWAYSALVQYMMNDKDYVPRAQDVDAMYVLQALIEGVHKIEDTDSRKWAIVERQPQ